MKLTLTIDSQDQDAHDNPQEVACLALDRVRTKIANYHESGILRDANGNRIGEWSFDPEQDDEDAEDED